MCELQHVRECRARESVRLHAVSKYTSMLLMQFHTGLTVLLVLFGCLACSRKLLISMPVSSSRRPVRPRQARPATSSFRLMLPRQACKLTIDSSNFLPPAPVPSADSLGTLLLLDWSYKFSLATPEVPGKDLSLCVVFAFGAVMPSDAVGGIG